MACGCRGVCACVVTAGENVTVTGAGTGTNPYVVNAAGAGAVQTGCGLSGDGTAGDPLAAAPAAGQEPWPWTCDDAESTLKCDPDTGQLWTPPEHSGWHDAAPPGDALPAGSGPIGPTGGPVGISANWFIQVFPGSDGDCRNRTANMTWCAAVDVTYSADAEFRIGWLLNQDGGADEFAVIGGILDAADAGRQILDGCVLRWSGVLAAGDGTTWNAVPAVEVLAGQITVNSWVVNRSFNRGTLPTPA